MPLTSAMLILLIKEELNRQAQESRHPGFYVYADDDLKTIGVDGELNLEEFAEAIQNAERLHIE